MSFWNHYRRMRSKAEYLNQSAQELLQRSLPPGTPMAWDHNGHLQRGVVEWVGGTPADPRVRVTNERTGVTHTIYASHLRPERA